MVLRSESPGWCRPVLALLFSAVCTIGVAAQQPSQAPRSFAPLTVDQLYSFEGWTRFNGNQIATMSWVPEDGPWLDDTHYLWPARDSDASTWLRVDAVTGNSQPLFNVAEFGAVFSKATGLPRDEAIRIGRLRPSVFTSRHDGFLVSSDNTLYYYDIPKASLTRLTTSTEPKTEATFSPDGRLVAFIKENNLYVTDISVPGERALTTDGAAKVLNGVLDWVYSEELYGRGRYRAYWWSPDSSRIALLRLDDRLVPDYTLANDTPYRPILETWSYPKAGDPNPRASLLVIDVGDALRRAVRGEPPERTSIDTSKYSQTDGFLIANAGWTPDSRSVVYQLLNRQQTWLDFNTADPRTGATMTLFRESGNTWVERWADESADPMWLKDGSFLWLSERSGWRHLYHYRANGTLVNQVTDGEWEVRSTYGVDTEGEWIYFSGTERSPIGTDVYRAKVNGGLIQRLSTVSGTHAAFFNPSRAMYLDKWSDVTTPPQVRLHATPSTSADGVLRIVDANPVTAAVDYGLSKPEFLQVKTRDGFVMEAMMIKPPDFDPARRYPVYQFTYGGPHLQQVVNQWTFSEYAYHQLLASKGVIVWFCDNRTASGKGARSAWPLYRNLGALELRDIEDCLAWLKQQPYVDGSHVGIAGVSYGGFMTLYALTHSTSFAMGIAEAAVSDWRDYDTIYTERYLGLPSENPDGYRRSSPRFNAADLHGELLLVHGALDDNVHPQNTTQFAYELQKAGKLFQMMIYPSAGHGISDPQQSTHLRQMMLDFTLRHLIAGP